jgi:hypothetical protein
MGGQLMLAHALAVMLFFVFGMAGRVGAAASVCCR